MRLTHGTGRRQHLRRPQNLQRTPRISPHDFASAVTRLRYLEIRLICRNRTLSVSYTQREEVKWTYIHVHVVHFLHIFEASYRHGGPATRPAASPGVARLTGDGNRVGLTGPVHRRGRSAAPSRRRVAPSHIRPHSALGYRTPDELEHETLAWPGRPETQNKQRWSNPRTPHVFVFSTWPNIEPGSHRGPNRTSAGIHDVGARLGV